MFFDLKRDLEHFFIEKSISRFLIEGDAWQNFALTLYEILKDLPLRIPKEGRDLLLQSEDDVHDEVVEFKFEDHFHESNSDMITFTVTFFDSGAETFSVDSKLLMINDVRKD